MERQGLITRNQSWLVAWVGPELVMMNGENGSYVSVNETGGRIWELLAQPQTFTSLCDALAAEFDRSPDAIGLEVRGFLEEMRAHGALNADSSLRA